MCDVGPAPIPKTCTENGGKVCDAKGECVQCVAPTDCAANSTAVCQVPTCSMDGMCGMGPAPSGTPCIGNPGGKVCDDNGQCVQCTLASDCPLPPGATACQAPICSNGTCSVGNAPSGTPCLGSNGGKVCTANGQCVGCLSDLDCGPQPAGGCTTNKCLQNQCMAVNSPQGSPCSQASGGNTCDDAGMCISAKYVFLSSKIIPPNFGGTQAADMACQAMAANATPPLGGTTWKSWTSDSLTPPAATRLMPNSSHPYLMLNGTQVAPDWAGLTSGMLVNGINMNENRAIVTTQLEVWTGTNPDGTSSGSSCGNWAGIALTALGTMGTAGAVHTEWTAKGTVSCGTGSTASARIYCFQQ